MIRISIKHLAAAVGVLAASSAFAVPVTVTFPAEASVFRHNPGVIIDLDEVAINAALPQDGSKGTIFDAPRGGEFRATVTDAAGASQQLFVFCIEVDQDIDYEVPLDTYQRIDFGSASTPAQRTADNGSGTARAGRDSPFADATKFALLNNLYTRFINLADNDATLAAAFQIALWEVRYDGAGALSLDGGSFVLADDDAAYAGGNAAAQQARDIAEGWLAVLTPTLDPALTFIQLTSNDIELAEWQDLIGFTPDTRVPPNQVPVPGSLALIGLGGLALARYRKQA